MTHINLGLSTNSFVNSGHNIPLLHRNFVINIFIFQKASRIFTLYPFLVQENQYALIGLYMEIMKTENGQFCKAIV